MVAPNVLVLTGFGINCEEETSFAFQKAGGKSKIRHLNDLIENPKQLDEYQLLVFPGGFSYGDDTGAGKALANKIRGNLQEEILNFIIKDKLVLGICNGFQVLAHLGLVPALEHKYGIPQAALTYNEKPIYLDRWVDLAFLGNSPWVNGIEQISLPIAHGEGKFYAPEPILKTIEQKGLVAARYVSGEISQYYGDLKPNPNGSLHDIAALTDETGRVLGMMPHPERGIFFTQLPHWPLLKEANRIFNLPLPEKAGGIKLFQNGLNYF